MIRGLWLCFCPLLSYHDLDCLFLPGFCSQSASWTVSAHLGLIFCIGIIVFSVAVSALLYVVVAFYEDTSHHAGSETRLCHPTFMYSPTLTQWVSSPSGVFLNPLVDQFRAYVMSLWMHRTQIAFKGLRPSRERLLRSTQAYGFTNSKPPCATEKVAPL